MAPGPLVSIVTPTLNSAATVERTMRSVLDQDYPRIEYVLIDGGSTDGTREIVRRYESRLAACISEPDAGIADAFNKGIRRCRGEVIGIINSDDYYQPGVLRRVADVFAGGDANRIVHGDLRYYNDHASRILQPWRLAHLMLYLDLPYNHPTYFVPRAIYEAVGLYDPGYRIAMDYDWTLRAALRGFRFHYLREVMAHFAIGGLASSNPRQCHAEVLRSQLSHGLNPLVCRATYAAKMTINRSKEVFGWSRCLLGRTPTKNARPLPPGTEEQSATD